jgi:hypothetical protein
MTNTCKNIFSSFLKKTCSFVLASEEIVQKVKRMSQVYTPKLFALYSRVMLVWRRYKTVIRFYVETYPEISQNEACTGRNVRMLSIWLPKCGTWDAIWQNSNYHRRALPRCGVIDNRGNLQCLLPQITLDVSHCQLTEYKPSYASINTQRFNYN